LYEVNDFLAAGRPTEILEKDIYLNEARYDEEEGQFRKLKGLKVYKPWFNFDLLAGRFQEPYPSLSH